MTEPKIGDQYWVAWFDKDCSDLSIATGMRVSYVTVVDIADQLTYEGLGSLCICVIKPSSCVGKVQTITCCARNLHSTPQEAIADFVASMEQQIPKWKAYIEVLQAAEEDTTVSHCAELTTHKQQESQP